MATAGGGGGGLIRRESDIVDLNEFDDVEIDGEEVEVGLNNVLVVIDDDEDINIQDRVMMKAAAAADGKGHEVEPIFAEDCGICAEALNSDPEITALPCGHVLHTVDWETHNSRSGIRTRDENTCPFCKAKANKTYLVKTGGPAEWSTSEKLLQEQRDKLTGDAKKARLTVEDAIRKKQKLYRAKVTLEYGTVDEDLAKVSKNLRFNGIYQTRIEGEIKVLAEQLNFLSSIEALASTAPAAANGDETPPHDVDAPQDPQDVDAPSPPPAVPVAPPRPDAQDDAERRLLDASTMNALPQAGENVGAGPLRLSGRGQPALIFQRKPNGEEALEKTISSILRRAAIFLKNQALDLASKEEDLAQRIVNLEEKKDRYTKINTEAEEVTLPKLRAARERVLAEGGREAQPLALDANANRGKRNRGSEDEAGEA